MTRFAIGVLLAAVVRGVLAPALLEAHRLDEYLQATRVAIVRDRVDLEIDLTPGVALAAQIFGAIDTDRDGEISSDEARRYASTVIDNITIEVDGHRAALSLSGDRFPGFQEMSRGIGAIRLSATAPILTPTGPHRLRVRNDHRSDIGVYLANALVPIGPDIEITAQARDTLQHELRIDYRVLPAVWSSPPALAAGGIAMILVLVVWRQGQGRTGAFIRRRRSIMRAS
jgi:hypothetical protein